MPIQISDDNTVVVSTQAELNDAFDHLTGTTGGTILLEAGVSYSVVFSDWLNTETDKPVVIRSADPDNKATIYEVTLTERENITIEDTKIHAAREDIGEFQQMLTIRGSENITFRGNEMSSNATGPAGTDDGHTVGVSLGSIRASSNVVIEDNTISSFMHGLMLMDTYDTIINNNDFTAMQGDAIRLGGASGVEIEGNHFHDFYGTPWAINHPDVIQFWGRNISVNNEDIMIRENVLDMGGAAAYQMIFGHNEHKATNNLQFTDITIEHNVLYGAHQHMISLSDTLNATVRNNTAIYSQDSYFVGLDGEETISQMTGRILITGDNSTVENNIGHGITSPLANTELTIGDPRLASDYTNHFINIEAGGSGDLRDITLRPDSDLNGVMGSHLTWYNAGAAQVRAIAQVEVAEFDRSVVTFDAGLSQAAGTGAATYTWVFPDGTTKVGQVVSHDFSQTGTQTYTLTITTASGETDTISRTVEIENTLTLELETQGNTFFSSANSAITIAANNTLDVADGKITIGENQTITVERTNAALFNLSALNYELTLDLDKDASGLFLHQHKTLAARVDEDGYVIFNLITDMGAFEVTSNTAVFANDAEHHLNLVYDGYAKELSIYVDGLKSGATFAQGVTASQEYWGLTIGSTWNGTLEGQIHNLKLTSEAASTQTTTPVIIPQSVTVEDVQDDEALTDSNQDDGASAQVTPEPVIQTTPNLVANVSDQSNTIELPEDTLEFKPFSNTALDVFDLFASLLEPSIANSNAPNPASGWLDLFATGEIANFLSNGPQPDIGDMF